MALRIHRYDCVAREPSEINDGFHHVLSPSASMTHAYIEKFCLRGKNGEAIKHPFSTYNRKIARLELIRFNMVAHAQEARDALKARGLPYDEIPIREEYPGGYLSYFSRCLADSLSRGAPLNAQLPEYHRIPYPGLLDSSPFFTISAIRQDNQEHNGCVDF